MGGSGPLAISDPIDSSAKADMKSDAFGKLAMTALSPMRTNQRNMPLIMQIVLYANFQFVR